MRIKDYIYQKIKPKEDEIQTLIQAIEDDENLDRVKCIDFLKQVILNTQNVYLEGINDTLAEVEQIDRNFLNREIPPHVK